MMNIFVHGDAAIAVDVDACGSVDAIKTLIDARTGIPASEQLLEYAGKHLRDGQPLSAYGISDEATLNLSLRLRGGAKVLQFTVKPRLQKDLWSLYWKESMETKTEVLDDVKLALPPSATVAEVQKEVEKKLGWEPISKLERLEGFTDPWETAVFKGRALQPDRSLQEQGITSGAEVITVRRKLVPEGWKIIKEGEEEEDESSEEEDW